MAFSKRNQPTQSTDASGKGVSTDGGVAVSSADQQNTTLDDFVHGCEFCDRTFDTANGVAVHEGIAHQDELPWHDEGRLRELYLDERLTISEIADRFGVDYRAIWNALDRFGIKRRAAAEYFDGVFYETYPATGNGDRSYERWVTAPDEDGSRQTVRIHRLCAVAWDLASADEIFGGGDVDIHHDVEIGWINTEWNLQALDHAEHARLESNRRWGSEDEIDVETPGYDWIGAER